MKNTLTLIIAMMVLLPLAAVHAFPLDPNEERLGIVALSDGRTLDRWEQGGKLWLQDHGQDIWFRRPFKASAIHRVSRFRHRPNSVNSKNRRFAIENNSH